MGGYHDRVVVLCLVELKMYFTVVKGGRGA